MENLDQLIEIAKEDSKNNILRFFKGMYNIDESVIGHLFDVPILSSYEDVEIIKTSLKTKNEDEILDILDSEIEASLGNSEAVFMRLDDLAINFSEEEIEEYNKKTKSGEIKEKYDCIIVYNPSKFKIIYQELNKKNKQNIRNPKTQEELDKMFIRKVSQTFTHERCHLNADILELNTKDPQDIEFVNGANYSMKEFDKAIDERKVDNDYSENTNEILMETLSEIITDYNYGDKVEDRLYDVIKQRGNGTLLENIKDTQQFLVYSVFPEELTEWLALGAYADKRKNLYKDLEHTMLGKNSFNIPTKNILEKAGNYCNDNKNLTPKQKEMLEMLGVKNLKKDITTNSIKNIANSDEVILNITENEASIVNKLNKEQKKEFV